MDEGEPSRQMPPGVEGRPIAGIFGPLAGQPIWLQWTTKYDEAGKPRKVPYSASGGEFSVADPTKWRALAEVERMRERGARRGTRRTADGSVPSGGVGLVLAPLGEGHHLGGVDLDACRDHVSGNVDDWAFSIVELLQSYTEVSPSGKGLKVFFFHDPRTTSGRHWRHEAKRKAEDGGKDSGIEFYLEKRFFAVTGRQYGHFDRLNHVSVVELLAVQELMKVYAPEAFTKSRTKSKSKLNGASPGVHGLNGASAPPPPETSEPSTFAEARRRRWRGRCGGCTTWTLSGR